MASWRTTLIGILTAIGILSAEALALIDADTATNPSWEQIAAALGLLGIGVLSRDNKVSSEKAGAK